MCYASKILPICFFGIHRRKNLNVTVMFFSCNQWLQGTILAVRAESDCAVRERSRYTKYSSTVRRFPDAKNLAVRMAQWAARVTARDHHSNVTLSFVTRFPLSSRLCIFIVTCRTHKKCKWVPLTMRIWWSIPKDTGMNLLTTLARDTPRDHRR